MEGQGGKKLLPGSLWMKGQRRREGKREGGKEGGRKERMWLRGTSERSVVERRKRET